MKHLWEIDHPYYCNESNYYSRECHTDYASWQDFLDEMGDADMDLNLLFRWDWHGPNHGDRKREEPCEWKSDENYRDSTLQLFYVGQRKGRFFCLEVSVCRADEPKIVEFLRPRLALMFSLWEPLTDANGSVKHEEA